MKTKNLLATLLVIAVTACRKEQPVNGPVLSSGDTANQLSLSAVKNWYGQQPALQAPVSPDWTRAASVKLKNSNYWIVGIPGQPTVNQVQQGYRKIAFIKDSSGNICARVLEIVPDAAYWLKQGRVTTADFTGRVYIFDEAYHFIGGKIYAGGTQVGVSKPATQLRIQEVYIYQDCEWYDSSYVDAEGVFTVHSDQLCSTVIYGDGFSPDPSDGGGGSEGDPLGSGGGGGDTAVAPQVAELPGETNPAINPKDYLKCFDTLPNDGAAMSVTVYVQEPQPGTAFPLGVNGVGHTAIGLSKTCQGVNITQVMGYYPASHAEILNGSSKIVDNSGMDYNVSITYNVTATQFNQIVAYMYNPPSDYKLYGFNCTDFAVAALKQGNINLPSASTGTGQGGALAIADNVSTPGGLGRSLENMKGQSNVNNSGGRMPNGHGACN